MKKNYVLQVLVMFPLLMFSQWTQVGIDIDGCLLYTSPSPRDGATSRMPSSA